MWVVDDPFLGDSLDLQVRQVDHGPQVSDHVEGDLSPRGTLGIGLKRILGTPRDPVHYRVGHCQVPMHALLAPLLPACKVPPSPPSASTVNVVGRVKLDRP